MLSTVVNLKLTHPNNSTCWNVKPVCHTRDKAKQDLPLLQEWADCLILPYHEKDTTALSNLIIKDLQHLLGYNKPIIHKLWAYTDEDDTITIVLGITPQHTELSIITIGIDPNDCEGHVLETHGKVSSYALYEVREKLEHVYFPGEFGPEAKASIAYEAQRIAEILNDNGEETYTTVITSTNSRNWLVYTFIAVPHTCKTCSNKVMKKIADRYPIPNREQAYKGLRYHQEYRAINRL